MTPDTLQAIFYHLINNSSRYKLEFKSFTDQKKKLLEEDPLFKDEIEAQYKSLLTSKMADDITKVLGVTIEDALIVLGDLNLEEYLK